MDLLGDCSWRNSRIAMDWFSVICVVEGFKEWDGGIMRDGSVAFGLSDLYESCVF